MTQRSIRISTFGDEQINDTEQTPQKTDPIVPFKVKDLYKRQTLNLFEYQEKVTKSVKQTKNPVKKAAKKKSAPKQRQTREIPELQIDLLGGKKLPLVAANKKRQLSQ